MYNTIRRANVSDHTVKGELCKNTQWRVRSCLGSSSSERLVGWLLVRSGCRLEEGMMNEWSDCCLSLYWGISDFVALKMYKWYRFRSEDCQMGLSDISPSFPEVIWCRISDKCCKIMPLNKWRLPEEVILRLDKWYSLEEIDWIRNKW